MTAAELLVRELRRAARLRDRQHAAGRRDLDRIGAVLVALANGLAAAVGAAADRIEARVVAGEERAEGVGRVRVAAAGADRAAGGEDARPRDLARLDGTPERNRHVPLVAEVAHGREARHERALREHRGVVGPVRLALLEAVELARAAVLGGQVHVHVHETRHHGGLREVHDLVAGARRPEAALDPLDAVALDDDRHALAGCAAHAIDQAAGVDQRRRGRDARGQERGQGRKADCNAHRKTSGWTTGFLAGSRSRRRAARRRR